LFVRSSRAGSRATGMAIPGPRRLYTAVQIAREGFRATSVGWDAWRAFLRLLDGLLAPRREGTGWSAARGEGGPGEAGFRLQSLQQAG
jgi:hypothetical protein